MKAWYVLIMLLLPMLFGCNGTSDDNPDPDPLTLSDAKTAASNSAGPDATDCGTVDIGADRSTANCCMATSAAGATSAYALYMEQGIDSTVATAVSVDKLGKVTYFLFDGVMGDFSEDPVGQIVENPCTAPEPANNVCSNTADPPFACS